MSMIEGFLLGVIATASVTQGCFFSGFGRQPVTVCFLPLLPFSLSKRSIESSCCASSVRMRVARGSISFDSWPS